MRALPWIVGLFALALLTSQTAIDFLATILTITVLVLGFRWRQQKSAKTIWVSVGLDWLFLIWIASIFASFASNSFASPNWYLVMIQFKWIFVFYMLLVAFREIQVDQRTIKVVAIAYAFCSLWAIVIWFLGFDPIHPNDQLQMIAGGTFRTGGFLFQPIAFAHIYQLPLCIFLGCFLSMIRWKEENSKLVLISVLLGSIAIFLSFTRGVWISLTIASLVMLFIYSRRLAIGFLTVGLVAFGLAYNFIPLIHERVRYGMDGGDTERIWIWKANLEMFREHPIFGIGYTENKPQLRDYYRKIGAPQEIIDMNPDHAHNQYLQMLSGTGAVGFLAYLAVFIYFFVLSIRVYYRIGSREMFHQGLALGLIGAQVAFFAGGLTEANLEHEKMKHAIIVIWALTVWLAYEYGILRERVHR